MADDMESELKRLPALEQIEAGVRLAKMQTQRYIRWALGAMGFMFVCIGMWFLEMMG